MTPQLLSVAVSTRPKRPSESPPAPPERPEKHPRIEVLSTDDEASRKHDMEARDSDRLRRLRSVNRSVMSMFEGALNRDPGADLTTLLESYAQTYPGRRKKVEKQALKALVIPFTQPEIAPQTGATATPLKSNVPYDLAKPRLSREAKRTLQVPPGIVSIYSPLAPSVLDILSCSNEDDASSARSPESPQDESTMPLLSQQLGRVLIEGELLWHLSGKAVVKLSETVVVKLGKNMNLDQVDVMGYIRRNSKNIPVPESLGAFTIEKVSYIFMSYTEGTTLETRWPGMGNEGKSIIQNQLNTIMEELRQIPFPPGFNLGWNDRCKDTRRHSRQSGLIVSEKEFNEFLLSNPLPRVTKPYLEMIRSRLRDDHQIVLTHGNLHPRNIVVADDLTITGLIDWGVSGWYPEYWEHIKALNNISATEPVEADWWQYLPKSIGTYHTEWALDRQLEAIVYC